MIYSGHCFSVSQGTRECSVLTEHFFKNVGTLEHFEMFPGTFKKLLIKQKLQCYVVTGQKFQKLRGFLDWKFIGMNLIMNLENLGNLECKNYMVMVYLYIFCCLKMFLGTK